MGRSLDEDGLKLLFREARTYSHWLDRPVSDGLLRELYDLMKMGPTSANCCPIRIHFVRTPEAKAKLLLALDAGNIEKTRTAPVTAILGHDMKFYEKLPTLFPHVDARSWFVDNPELVETTAFRNGTLQAAYFILAARSLGIDCGPMSGFDAEKLEQAFFRPPQHKMNVDQVHVPESHIRVNFLCNLGYGDPDKLHPRLSRLEFHEACKLL